MSSDPESSGGHPAGTERVPEVDWELWRLKGTATVREVVYLSCGIDPDSLKPCGIGEQFQQQIREMTRGIITGPRKPLSRMEVMIDMAEKRCVDIKNDKVEFLKIMGIHLSTEHNIYNIVIKIDTFRLWSEYKGFGLPEKFPVLTNGNERRVSLEPEGAQTATLSAPKQQYRDKGGRRDKFPWKECLIDLSVYFAMCAREDIDIDIIINNSGNIAMRDVNDQETTIFDWMNDWFSKRVGPDDVPSSSSIFDMAKKVNDSFRRAAKIGNDNKS